ncbi:hypothetical protein ACIGCZ_32755 [Streptomyces nigra]|uniref:hypothetical protein n=1 Tax=Streptomyces nigra TaxID=1827580 RepID=UPI0037CFE443
MTQPQLPPQRAPEPRTGERRPVDPARSEACRLLCAGTYLHVGYRDAVIDELYVHRERFAAPSYGFDAARVLAHALRARRQEVAWAAGMAGLWVVAAVLTKWLIVMVVLPILLIALGRRLGGSRAVDRQLPQHFALIRRLVAFTLRWYGRIALFRLYGLLVLVLVAGAEEAASDGSVSGSFGASGDGFLDSSDSGDFGVLNLLAGDFADLNRFTAACLLALPLLLALLSVGQRGLFARTIAGELSKERFPDVAGDPAEAATGPRFRELSRRIRQEQHAPLILYAKSDPFRGAGVPFEPWSLSIELRPRDTRDGDSPIDALTKPGAPPVPAEPLDNDTVLQKIRPLLEELREPSARTSGQAADVVIDRLRELVVDECVFLPAEGLPSRMAFPYTPETYAMHRADAVEEGGEQRRHFLRVRVGGWDEEIVVTVFVRVHTQGGMLMLEVAPHVLPPVDPLFATADRMAHEHLHRGGFGRYVFALLSVPATTGEALRVLVRAVAQQWRQLTGVHADTLPDGPGASVRELGADDRATLFQEMDIARYLKSVQDRIAGGVRQALWNAGYDIAEFEQKVTNVFNNSGTFVGGSVQGNGIAIGRDSKATAPAGKPSGAPPARSGGASK